MQLIWFELLTLVTQVFASRNEIARDYFVFKNVRSVVAFLCPDTANNFDLLKMLNGERISVAILYPEFEVSLDTAMKLKDSRFGVFLDLYCANRYNKFILEESSEFKTYNESFSWLLFGKNLNESIRMLNDDTFSITTDLVIVTPNIINDGYDLHDVYNPGKERFGKLNVTYFASWDNKTGLIVTLVQEKYQRRQNFHGMKLKVIGLTQYRPDDMRVEDYLQDYSNRQLDSMSKFTYTILLHIGDLFNFTPDSITERFELTHTADVDTAAGERFMNKRMEIMETALWDQVDSDGTHQGMVGMLYRSEADFGGSPARITKERSALTQLIYPAWPFRSCFMFRTMPTRMHDEFFRPLTLDSWIATGAMSIICVIILSLTLKLESIKARLNTWNEAILVTTGIMCQQGSTITPQSLSGRIVIIQLLVFSVLIYNYYSASVVSAQLNSPLDKMNDSLHQLAESRLEVAAEPITYTNYGLTALNDWEVKEFYEKRWKPLADEIRYIPLEEGFERVAKGGFAYHTDPNTGYPYIERLFSDQMICELTEVHLFPPQIMPLWGRRDSPFTKMARIGMTKISSAGLLFRESKRWASRKPECFRESFMLQSVSLLSTAPAFIILSIGIVIAVSIYFVENAIAKSRN